MSGGLLPQPERTPVPVKTESVWDYPRPPRLEPTDRHIQVLFAGQVIADTRRALRVLETSHPPAYYIPPQDVRMDMLVPSTRHTYCEYKGEASYWTLKVGETISEDAAWSYPKPNSNYHQLKDYLAFYAGRVDECLVDGKKVQPQSGAFYGGWITPDVTGPFKGGPGTNHW
jgi:uncharacterized protein (DUF427 family)